MSYLLGIDLGATVVTAAVHSGDRTGLHAMPAVVVATPAGDLLCGEPARRRAPADPGRVARGFLERVGDPTPLSLGGAAHRAEDLCARLVRFLVDDVSGRYGAPPARIGVTHPVSWGRHKRDLLAGALARCGLTVSLVAAPQAVALAHRAATPGTRPLAVVDLGGNGSTVTVFDAAAPGALPAAAGRSSGCRAGGADVDDAVFGFVRAAGPELVSAFDALDADDPSVLTAIAALREDCRAAKEQLSRDTVTTVRVDLPGVRTSVRIHRSDLDEIAGPLLEPVADPLAEALAGVPDADVLLAGGTARMPVAVQVLSAALGRPLAVAADPVHDAARGAAMAVAPGAGVARPGIPPPDGPGARTAGPGTSWPGSRFAPLPAGAVPAPRSADGSTVPAGSAPRAATATTRRAAAPAVSPVSSPSSGSVATAPVQAPPTLVAPGAYPTARSVPAGLPAGLPAAPSGPFVAPRPERPGPAGLVTRDTGRAAVSRSALRRRVLLGTGGLAAVAAVAGTLLLWPSEPGLGQLSASPTLPSPSVPAPAPVAPGAPAASDGPEAPASTAPTGTGTDPATTGPAGSTTTAATGGTTAPATPGAAPPPAPVPPAPPPPAPVVPPVAPAPAPAPVPAPQQPSEKPPATDGTPDEPGTGTGTPPPSGGTTLPATPGVTSPPPPPGAVT